MLLNLILSIIDFEKCKLENSYSFQSMDKENVSTLHNQSVIFAVFNISVCCILNFIRYFYVYQ